MIGDHQCIGISGLFHDVPLRLSHYSGPYKTKGLTQMIGAELYSLLAKKRGGKYGIVHCMQQ